VAANYRCRAGELDLLMTDGAELVVVEVRYRARSEPVDPALTVTARKRRRLLRATVHFLQHHRHYRDCALRFDVLAICGPDTAPAMQWFRNAFNGEELA
jgi:putative endonuclease